MVETSENQKKMNKVLQDLLKSGFVKNDSNNVANDATEADSDKKRKRKERDRSRDRDEAPKDKRSR